jgi:hypothetical protein
MHRFHIIPEAEAIIVSKSVFKTVKLFQRDGGLYAAMAGGYVRLYAGGNTGLPNVRWDDMEFPGIANAKSMLKNDAHGKLTLPTALLTIEG